jgi:hypothetical protein
MRPILWVPWVQVSVWRTDLNRRIEKTGAEIIGIVAIQLSSITV